MSVFDKKEKYNITYNLRMTGNQSVPTNRTIQKDKGISNAMYTLGREEVYVYIVE